MRPSTPRAAITLNWFGKRPYRIHHAYIKDLPALLKLEQACWPPHLQVTEPELSHRLERYPEGQCVLEIDAQIVGVIYSQRIASTQQLKNIHFTDLPTLHQPDGPVVQLITVNILPDKQHLGLGDQLLEFMLQYCTVKPRIERVVGVTRCKNYSQHPGIPLQNYIQQKDAQGLYQDPILRFHHAHGA